MFSTSITTYKVGRRFFAPIIALMLLIALSCDAPAWPAGPPQAGEPVWSPHTRETAYTWWRDGNWDIYVRGADGADETRLTTDPAFDGLPTWSPDGRQIAFISERDGNREIYVMNADGSGLTRLTAHPALDGLPTWSLDGRRIAFISERDGNREIYVVNADGSGLTRLTAHPAEERNPSWSPGRTSHHVHLGPRRELGYLCD